MLITVLDARKANDTAGMVDSSTVRCISFSGKQLLGPFNYQQLLGSNALTLYHYRCFSCLTLIACPFKLNRSLVPIERRNVLPLFLHIFSLMIGYQCSYFLGFPDDVLYINVTDGQCHTVCKDIIAQALMGMQIGTYLHLCKTSLLHLELAWPLGMAVY